MDFLVTKTANYLIENKDILLTPFINLCSLYIPEKFEIIEKLRSNDIKDIELIKELFMFYSLKSYDIDKGINNKTKLVLYLIDQREVKKTLKLLFTVFNEIALKKGDY